MLVFVCVLVVVFVVGLGLLCCCVLLCSVLFECIVCMCIWCCRGGFWR